MMAAKKAIQNPISASLILKKIASPLQNDKCFIGRRLLLFLVQLRLFLDSFRFFS